MKIITLETLKSMPNGTVFCEIDKLGNLERDIRVLTGRFENREGFNGEIGLYPFIAEEDGHFAIIENSELIKDKHFATEWITTDTANIDYDENQLFVVFSKKEVEKMIKVLQWALSGLEDNFDMDEMFIGEKVERDNR